MDEIITIYSIEGKTGIGLFLIILVLVIHYFYGGNWINGVLIGIAIAVCNLQKKEIKYKNVH